MNEYPEILILGRDTCEDTIRSRGHLHLLGIPYVYRNVELDPAADTWNRSFNGGERRTPVIVVGDPDRPVAILIEPSDADLEAAVGSGPGSGAGSGSGPGSGSGSGSGAGAEARPPA